jgi:hypothetical protein
MSRSNIKKHAEQPDEANVDGTPFLEDETAFAKHAQLTRSSSWINVKAPRAWPVFRLIAQVIKMHIFKGYTALHQPLASVTIFSIKHRDNVQKQYKTLC